MLDQDRHRDTVQKAVEVFWPHLDQGMREEVSSAVKAQGAIVVAAERCAAAAKADAGGENVLCFKITLQEPQDESTLRKGLSRSLSEQVGAKIDLDQSELVPWDPSDDDAKSATWSVTLVAFHDQDATELRRNTLEALRTVGDVKEPFRTRERMATTEMLRGANFFESRLPNVRYLSRGQRAPEDE